jgi:hypothetical protein
MAGTRSKYFHKGKIVGETDIGSTGDESCHAYRGIIAPLKIQCQAIIAP